MKIQNKKQTPKIIMFDKLKVGIRKNGRTNKY